MSVIEDEVNDAASGGSSTVTAPLTTTTTTEDRPAQKDPAIKYRNKKHRVENGRLRPNSIHIFEDLEKNGVIPDKALSSYKSLARSQRMSRTMQALYSIDPNVAKDLFNENGSSTFPRPSTSMYDFPTVATTPSSFPNAAVGAEGGGGRRRPRHSRGSGDGLGGGGDDDDDDDVRPSSSSEEEKAASAAAACLCIQRHFRGFLGRRRYAARLYEVYAEEDEKLRIERESKLVEETEILIEARKAKIDMEELDTVKRNAERLLVSRVITIQRAWRAHRAQAVGDLPILAQSRIGEKQQSQGRRRRRQQPPPKPPSSISCDSIADRAMRRQGESTASSSSSAASSTIVSAFDREAIRLQLAMDDEDYENDEDDDDRAIRGSSTTHPQQHRRRFSDDAFLEVTLNDIPEDGETEMAATVSNVATVLGAAIDTDDAINTDDADRGPRGPEISGANNAEGVASVEDFGAPSVSSASSSSFREPLPRRKNAFDDACTKLRKETEIQLARATPLAQLQMELEKRDQEDQSSSIVDNFKELKAMVTANGLLGVGDMCNLNVASLQVLVNDLLNRVEKNNDELMTLLQERDQLHMEQDSMLVDIEDLIKQCKRQAELNNRRGIPR